MFGEKTAPFTIYEISEGEPKVYAVECAAAFIRVAPRQLAMGRHQPPARSQPE